MIEKERINFFNELIRGEEKKYNKNPNNIPKKRKKKGKKKSEKRRKHENFQKQLTCTPEMVSEYLFLLSLSFLVTD